MKKLTGYLRDYLRDDFNYRAFTAILLFTAACLYVNYFVLNEDVWIKGDPSKTRQLLKYLGGYAFVYGGAWLLQCFTSRDRKIYRQRGLWLLILFATVLFAVRAWIVPPQNLLQLIPFAWYTAGYKIMLNLAGLLLLGVPCAVYWWFADRTTQPLYGFRVKGVTLRPYLVLILAMLPLLLLAGTQPDFQDTYPRGSRLGLYATDPHRTVVTILYEICYSIDYIVTEFFFRGFLILAIARYAGHQVILPMCAFYVSIHFDKPIGEAVSSFFGGLILGVLAYRSRSIWGGVIVHLGIALAMEAVGWWHQ